MNDYCIYVAFHQNGKIIPDDLLYQSLQVGKRCSGLELEMQNDATGVNISEKNGVYSELTGWFWIWKNQNHDVVGTSHYRRYFTAVKPSASRKFHILLQYLVGLGKKHHGLYYVKNTEYWKSKIINKEQIEKILLSYDAILPVKKHFRYSVNEQYKRRHNLKHIGLVKEIISEIAPEYLVAFNEVFNSRFMYAFNMFILPWNLFDEYMNWLFPILFEFEKRIRIDYNDVYQKRVCAFMAERLQTVWFKHKNLKINELDVIYFKNLKTQHF